MDRSIFLCAICAIVLFLPSVLFLRAQTAQSSNQNSTSGSTIRLRVARVDLGVTVTDTRGHFVKGLHSKDFRIFDNGLEQPIESFASQEEHAQVVFLIEAGAEDALLAGTGSSPFKLADALLQNISPADRVAVVTYSDHAAINSEFTAEKKLTLQTLAALGVQLHNAQARSPSLNLAESLAETLDWLTTIPGNKTIVLLSTGVDTSLETDWMVAQEKLRTSPVRVLGVSLMGDFRRPVKAKKLSPDQREDVAFIKKVVVESDLWMQRLTSETGGRFYLPQDAKQFQRSFAEIGKLADGEYSLEFAPVASDGRLHSIEVRLKPSGHRVEYRKAYRAPSPPPA